MRNNGPLSDQSDCTIKFCDKHILTIHIGRHRAQLECKYMQYRVESINISKTSVYIYMYVHATWLNSIGGVHVHAILELLLVAHI